MPIQTVGTSEVLLQVVSEYQGLNGRRATPVSLWGEVAKFLQASQEPVFRAYQMSGRTDPQRPNAQFLADLRDLIRHRFLHLGRDGRLELTAVGQCLTFGRMLPPMLQPLAEQVAPGADQ